jgi:hypothetical protein
MKAIFSGACLCGAVRYESSSKPVVAGQCYCEDCRRSSGTAHSSVLGVPEEAFRITGETRAFSKEADSGNTVTRNFCPNCGSFMHATNTGFPGMIFLKAGTLDDPEIFNPQMVVYASRAPSWDKPDGSLPAFPEMPPKGDRPKQMA